MPKYQISNKRIAKNTMLLYFRSLVVMLVSLFTSRVVLRVLGVEDYGIYNVVGGVVVMFSFLATTLGSATQRYIAYELPRNNFERLKETFSLIFLSYGILGVITFLLAEIIGVWFLNTYMNIPEERMVAANWVLQGAIFGFILKIMTSPYISVLIAHERMNIYAYLSIVDVSLKLISVYLLQVIHYDKLIVYTLIMLMCTSVIRTIYRIYCRKHFAESHYTFFFDKVRFMEITSFAWWNMVGTISNVLRNQGVNIVLNLFFNPAINAARAIAYQVDAAIHTLITNFYTALRPQITKSYSMGDVEHMRSLIISSSRLSFSLLLLLSLPIYLNAEQILEMWLGSFPDYTTIFVKLVLFSSLMEVFSSPLVAGVQATGEIKMLQIMVSGVYLLNLPISYIVLAMGYPPQSVFYVNMILIAVGMIPRLYVCHKYYNLNVPQYVFGVLSRCLFVFIVCYIVGSFLVTYFNCDKSIIDFLICNIFLILFIITVEFLVGLSQKEKKMAVSLILRRK